MSSIPAAARHSYWDALAAGDARAAVAVALRLAEAGVPVEALLADLVCEGQAEVGRRWAANEWSVAREHAATSVSEEVVLALAARAPAAPARGKVVVTCVEGEWHSLPARVLSETLRLAGWQVQYLGASVPTAHLVQHLYDIGPDVTALSCSVATSLPRARRMIEGSRQAGVPVICGGRGFGAGGRWARPLGADGWAPTAASAVTLLASPSWPAFADPAPPLVHPDDEYPELRERARDLVAAAMQRLDKRLPAMAAYDTEQRARTEEDLGHLLDFLATALFVDDSRLFTEFVTWMADVLSARGVPPAAVRLGLEIFDELLTGMPRALDVVTAGREALAAHTGSVSAAG